MKFTLSWLKTHLETDATLDQITDTLTRIGLELEGVEDRGAALAPFRIARVIEAVQHPNADRLRVCTVDTGSDTVRVVCGAPNARTGMKGVFAPPGTFIPGTGITLKVGEIRGVRSAGMLLSEREMGLGDDHAGIVDLPEDAPVGVPYARWAGLDDPVIDVSVTPNRGDCFSVRGIARDLAAAGIGTLKPWQPAKIAPAFRGGPRWQIDWPEACPWILGRTIRNLRNGPSPRWLQDRLTSIGLRPINTLVDITNFFTIDLGRPLHVFDVAKLAGDVLTLRPGRGETFRALNGRDYTVTAEDCAIADAAGVQSMAGVIGGEATGCDETTTSVFIECALFDPIRVALTGRRHQIVSDARQRFERGIDPALMPDAVEAATAMVLELCGGEPGEVTEAGAPPAWQRTATLRFERIAGLGGSDISAGRSGCLAGASGLRGAEPRRGRASPSRCRPGATTSRRRSRWNRPRRSIPASPRRPPKGCAEIEPECDLVEEVLRLRGLDAVPPVSLPRASPVPLATLTPRQVRTELARRTLAAQGLAECVTFSFMAQTEAALFGDTPEALRLTNPIAADLDQLRPTPIATLALAAQRNAARGYPDVALFEIGPEFAIDAAGEPALDRRRPARRRDAAQLAGAIATDRCDGRQGRSVGGPWRRSACRSTRWCSPRMRRASITRAAPPPCGRDRRPCWAASANCTRACSRRSISPGRSPRSNSTWMPSATRSAGARRAPDLPPFQPIRRDFAFLVDSAVTADAVLRAARGADRTLISGVSLFDVYQGERLPPGKKSLAIEVVFQPRERTLTDAEIEAASQKVVAAVAKATGATLR